jgi:hypothetical protein
MARRLSQSQLTPSVRGALAAHLGGFWRIVGDPNACAGANERTPQIRRQAAPRPHRTHPWKLSTSVCIDRKQACARGAGGPPAPHNQCTPGSFDASSVTIDRRHSQDFYPAIIGRANGCDAVSRHRKEVSWQQRGGACWVGTMVDRWCQAQCAVGCGEGVRKKQTLAADIPAPGSDGCC